ncbi:MAG: DVU0524 family FlgM-associated protein [Desulforegulaceae bacterium]|nr:DVU0524 family FlgM-associated protein [Desulforegulaceae bacterium]
MQIPAYQIHNVLKAYSRQVSQNKLNAKARPESMKNTAVDKISISPEGKKQGVIDKVASDILQKLTKQDPDIKPEKNLGSRPGQEPGGKSSFLEKYKNNFSYYEIDGNSKRKNTFSFKGIDNSKTKTEELSYDLPIKDLAEDEGDKK